MFLIFVHYSGPISFSYVSSSCFVVFYAVYLVSCHMIKNVFILMYYICYELQGKISYPC